jgi:hypothetical protein
MSHQLRTTQVVNKMDNKYTIAQFITLTSIDQYGDGVHKFGVWYDWFCTNKGTVVRGKALVSKLKAIANSKKFDKHNTYVFFKNNCPVNGSLYDDFRICDMKTGDLLFTVVPKEGYTNSNGLGSVWGKTPDGKFDELFKGTWKEIKQWFNS